MRIYHCSLIFSILLIPLFLLTEACGQTCIEKAKLLYREARFNDAITELNGALEAAPGDAQAYLYRGNAYFAKEDFKSAIRDYTKAIEIKPDYALAYYNRAVAYYSSQDYEMAWNDVHSAYNFGYEPHIDFIGQLKEDSGRNE
jgi:tetratricopeptide (TPR) repeat protein